MNIVDIDAMRPHLTIDAFGGGSVHVIPVKTIEDIAFGKIDITKLDHYKVIVPTIIGEWLRHIKTDKDRVVAQKPAQLPHQQRVIDEKKELDTKATALSNFIGYSPIFETLDPAEQERMKEQCEIMWQYSEILGARIAAFCGA